MNRNNEDTLMYDKRGLLVCMLTIFLLLASSGVRSGDFVDLVKRCEACHGEDGNSRLPVVPSIAGFSYEGFLNTMDVFRENERIALEFQRPGEPETVMNDIARSLSDEEVDLLAKYFSERPFLPVRQAAGRIDLQLSQIRIDKKGNPDAKTNA